MEAFGFERLPEVVRQLFEKVEKVEALLLRLQEDGPSEKMLSVQQAADFLQISRQAVYTMVSRKVIPVHKPGKRLYFDREDLEEWIRQGRKTRVELSTFFPKRSRPAQRR